MSGDERYLEPAKVRLTPDMQKALDAIVDGVADAFDHRLAKMQAEINTLKLAARTKARQR